MRALVRERGRFLLYLWHHITDLSSFLSVMHNIKRSGRSAPLPLCCFFSFVASICPLPRNLEHIALRHTNVLGVRSLMISYITSSSSLPRLDNTQRAAILKRDHVPPLSPSRKTADYQLKSVHKPTCISIWSTTHKIHWLIDVCQQAYVRMGSLTKTVANTSINAQSLALPPNTFEWAITPATRK